MQILQLLGVLIGGATLANAAPIEVWWDGTCDQRVKDAFAEAVSYAAKGNAGLASTDARYQDLHTWIFGPANQAPVRSILNDISQTTITQNKDINGNQLAIYCDGDRRWIEADDTIANGNSGRRAWPKAMYDVDNDIVFDPKAVTAYKTAKSVPAEARSPGCLIAGTNAETYVRFDRTNWKYTNFATMTICDSRLSQGHFKVQDEIDAKVDLTANNPSIDNYALVAQTILHEMTHHPLLGDTNDYGYKWGGVVGLAAGPNAVKNADSYAYFGLGAWLLDHVDLQQNGQCYPKADP